MRMRELKDKLQGMNSRCERLEEALRACWLAADVASTCSDRAEMVVFLKGIKEECEKVLREGLDK